MNNAPIVFILQAILTYPLQRILLVEVAKTLPQGGEAGREQLGRAEKIFREDGKALRGVGGGIGVNAGGAFPPGLSHPEYCSLPRGDRAPSRQPRVMG